MMFEASTTLILTALIHNEWYGFLGCYIVKPKYRGRRYGIQIWKAGVARLGGRSVGLDACAVQVSNYQKSGFHAFCLGVRHTVKFDRRILELSPNTFPLNKVPIQHVVNFFSCCFRVRGAFFPEWARDSNVKICMQTTHT